MLNYESLSIDLEKRIKADRMNGYVSPYAFNEDEVIRRNVSRDIATAIRTPFIRDIDKIMHCPYYNRYADKTQVFSFYKNDDITRRGLHVQLVSRIARTIGKALGLNLDLIEAIALGHDIGHTPFGHAGESFLDKIYYSKASKHFSHNIHSVRVLDGIFNYNISLQTLNGIAAHDGEMELCEYHPLPLDGFSKFDKQIDECYLEKSNIKKLVPCTLEGCVVRISDIIAYLGKDRQDAEKAHIIANSDFEVSDIGTYNAEIINNLIVNIIENSYDKPYIMLDDKHFTALKKAKKDNYELIYKNEEVEKVLSKNVEPMMEKLYEKLYEDLKNKELSSPIFTHHIAYVNKAHYKRESPYEATEENQIVVDYIASMTDDYFIDLYNHLFGDDKKIDYIGYFIK
ncbi:MAG: HD domain-containing protein [Clostridia bacterium]|nr:HD domain-containing protein [Clostridia bacterium]